MKDCVLELVRRFRLLYVGIAWIHIDFGHVYSCLSHAFLLSPCNCDLQFIHVPYFILLLVLIIVDYLLIVYSSLAVFLLNTFSLQYVL